MEGGENGTAFRMRELERRMAATEAVNAELGKRAGDNRERIAVLEHRANEQEEDTDAIGAKLVSFTTRAWAAMGLGLTAVGVFVTILIERTT